ncbi:phosphotransferase family protein [Rhodococcus gannanensis]|uniref:Phosphotransferase family protein n=1 Tax=Rhodococcus gannanensis TaxID=1960308 RepID=A0ABW4NY02_9NOCA
MSTDTLRAALERRIREVLGDACTVSEPTRLTGGASRETWTFTVSDPSSGSRDLILRRDPPGFEDPQRMTLEAESFTEALRAGVPVPALVDHSSGHDHTADALGSAYLLMDKLPGEALPQRLLRDDRYAAVRATLPYELGRTLARIHHMDTDAVPGLTGGDQVEHLSDMYRETGTRLPVLEIAFRWLREHRPLSARDTVVHGDFRNGNLLLDESGVRAVLDWELVHRGDPMEDLGWLCVKTWRFGSPLPVGGFGDRTDLFRGYEDECGIAPDPESVRWWELYGTLRWAVMCRHQANRGLVDGEDNTLELLAIGRRVAECEKDLLDLLGLGHDDAPVPVPDTAATDDLFGRPSATELLDVVREFVRHGSAGADPQSVYLARVAANVLGVAGREAALGAELRTRHREALRGAGFESESALADALRAGTASADDPAVAHAVRQAAAARLAVANPRY